MAKRLILSVSSSEIEGAPEIIKLLPLGLVKSQKGNFTVDKDSFELIQQKFKERGLDIVIDYEHQTLENVQAPAAGWIKELILEEDSISAKVQWTPKAQEYLKNKEYKYLSPVVLVNKGNSKAVVLHSAALTNTPAIDNMFAIVNSIDISEYQGGNEMDLEKLAALLGLSKDATEEEVIAALKKLNDASQEQTQEVVANKVICGLLEVDEKAKTEDVAAAIMALKNPSNFVPVSEFKALKERLDKRDSGELVMKALKDGKISAAQKEWAEEYALKDPSGFSKFIEKAPQVVPMGSLDVQDPPQGGKSSEEVLKVCKYLGISKEDYEKFGKEVE